MATSRIFLTALIFSSLSIYSWGVVASEPPQQLIRDVVYNELRDHATHGYWEFLVKKRVGHDVITERQIETQAGPIHSLVAINGSFPPVEQLRQEEGRLDQLVNDCRQQHKIKKQYEEDEQRIERILKLLPDAFLYEYASEENGNLHLNFRPNPNFHPQTIEARIFHAMQGSIWISRSMKHLVKLQGTLVDDVEFGFGLLGRLNKGGWFDLERVQVSATDWKTTVLEVHMTGKAIFLKTISKDTQEVRSGFRSIPRDMTLAQAKSLLDKEEAQNRLSTSTVDMTTVRPATWR